MIQNGIVYPDPLPSPVRLPDGSVRTIDGAILPFAASCPPNTSPNPATLSCESWPGADNINFACNGSLVAPGAAGCAAVPPNAERHELRQDTQTFRLVRDSWASCYRDDGEVDRRRAADATAAAVEGKANFDSLVGCFIVGAALAAVFFSNGGRR